MSYPNLPSIVAHGRMVADAELRFTPSGKAVANFTVASSERRKDRTSGEWVDGDKCFLRCAVWGEAAESLVESVRKGDQVVVTGRLFQREYETREGEKRTSVEVRVDSVAAEIDRATVKVTRAERGQARAGADQWASAPAASGVGFSDEPPF